MSAVQTIHPGNLQCFLDVYREELTQERKDKPFNYRWADSDFETVFGRMSAAIERGSFNKDSAPFRKTCKRLGIKHTYAAIREFISL